MQRDTIKERMRVSMDKKMSVIVIAYNTKEKYLRNCIKSIINQSLKEIEIIIVNDGSTNNVKNVCEQYAENDKRIKIINQSNQGESVARNVGIQNATTNHITFVDSDDWIEENMCEELYKYITKINEQYDVIVFNCMVDYINRSVKNDFYNKNGLLTKEDIKQIQLQNIEKGISKYYPPEANISVVWAKVYNKEFIEKYDIKCIPNIIRMPDALFNMEAFEKAEKIYVFPEYFYHYQKNDFAVCQRYSKDTINYYETYIKYVKEYIEKYNKEEEFTDILNVKIITSIDKYMYNYFFHKDNPKKFKEIEKEFKGLLQKEEYQLAMKEVKQEYLGKYQKLVLKSAKKGNVKELLILKKIKDTIKFLQGKRTIAQ